VYKYAFLLQLVSHSNHVGSISWPNVSPFASFFLLSFIREYCVHRYALKNLEIKFFVERGRNYCEEEQMSHGSDI